MQDLNLIRNSEDLQLKKLLKDGVRFEGSAVYKRHNPKERFHFLPAREWGVFRWNHGVR
jgi:hypothetical protein